MARAASRIGQVLQHVVANDQIKGFARREVDDRSEGPAESAAKYSLASSPV